MRLGFDQYMDNACDASYAINFVVLRHTSRISYECRLWVLQCLRRHKSEHTLQTSLCASCSSVNLVVAQKVDFVVGVNIVS